jgi:hypothetical protein
VHSNVKHFASADFWLYYRILPEPIRVLADKNFALLKTNLRHPSLRLKKAGAYWSVRVGIGYRALGKERAEGIVWVWIGSHADYDERLK